MRPARPERAGRGHSYRIKEGKLRIADETDGRELAAHLSSTVLPLDQADNADAIESVKEHAAITQQSSAQTH